MPPILNAGPPVGRRFRQRAERSLHLRVRQAERGRPDDVGHGWRCLSSTTGKNCPPRPPVPLASQRSSTAGPVKPLQVNTGVVGCATSAWAPRCRAIRNSASTHTVTEEWRRYFGDTRTAAGAGTTIGAAAVLAAASAASAVEAVTTRTAAGAATIIGAAAVLAAAGAASTVEAATTRTGTAADAGTIIRRACCSRRCIR